MSMLWIGIDDTDSTTGGCTTYVMHQLIKELQKREGPTVKHPRLIRLNPNVPWKTRGNGAVSVKVKEKNILKVSSIVQNVVENYAFTKDPKTNPGFMVSPTQPPFELYVKGVQGFLEIDKIIDVLESLGAEYKGYKNNRGLIGATASAAWSPQHDKTYELIAYREEQRWGTTRVVDDNSVRKMDQICSETFDNYDYENQHNRIVPHSPCPVLFGIRGETPEAVHDAQKIIVSEPVAGWTIFESNQGTDDHLVQKDISEVNAFDSVIIDGKVTRKPRVIEGGHVVFSVEKNGNEIDCAAYEPTKQFREIIKKLYPGDIVEVHGGVRSEPFTVNIEKINVQKCSHVIQKTENPVCPKCGKHMKSVGLNQGYRCKKCGTKAEGKDAHFSEKKRDLKPGFYEVPVCARRHISKPLKRMKP